MKKYLLFDLDGTLTDPKIGITTCAQYALRSFGIEEPDLDKLEPFIGPPLQESFMEFYHMDEEQAKQAVEKYRERFQDVGLYENEVYCGIAEMLRELKARGMHLAVASSKPTVFVERILKHFQLDQYFEVVVGSELDGRRVNKDEVVREALSRLFHNKMIRPEEVYMIGDRKFDVYGAKTHGIESVAVAYGYGSVEELREAKADYVVCTVEELHRFLLRDVREDEYQRIKKAPPTQKIWVAVFPVILFMCVRLVSLFVLLYIAEFMGITVESGNASTILSALSYMVAAGMILKDAKRLIAKTAEDARLQYLKREPLRHYIMLFVASAGAVIGLNQLFSLTGLIAQSATYQEVAEQQYAAGFWVGLLCYSIVAPIAEELLFRGTVYAQLRRFSKKGVAIAMSALLFGFYHMNSVQGMYGFLIGCIMAYGYEYFGSFLIPVLIHMLANLLAYCLTYLPLSGTFFVSWPVCILCLAVAVVCILGLHRKKNFF